MEGKCLACRQKLGHYDSKWYDKNGNLFCSYVNHVGEPENFKKCAANVQECDELKSYVIYWNGKLHIVEYYTDG